jgi:hypothetical protein
MYLNGSLWGLPSFLLARLEPVTAVVGGSSATVAVPVSARFSCAQTPCVQAEACTPAAVASGVEPRLPVRPCSLRSIACAQSEKSARQLFNEWLEHEPATLEAAGQCEISRVCLGRLCFGSFCMHLFLCDFKGSLPYCRCRRQSWLTSDRVAQSASGAFPENEHEGCLARR